MDTGITTESVFYNDRTRQERTQSVAFITALGLCCILSIPLALSYFASANRTVSVAIESRINPNTAIAASLVRLPGIGPKRAQTIIEYRKNTGEKNIAFKTADDLQKIKGIGPKTVENIAPYLCFE